MGVNRVMILGAYSMSHSEDVDTILTRWQGKDIRRREGSLPVWDIGRVGLFARHRRQRREAVAACRQELLTTLLRHDGPVFLMSTEPPSEYDVPGSWQPSGQATWLVSGDFSLDHPAVKHWLFDLGNWTIYSAPQPVEGKWPDVFRCSAAGLVAWISAKAVRVLIESFHDDTDWVVAFKTVE
jgi:hypothetical protein